LWRLRGSEWRLRKRLRGRRGAPINSTDRSTRNQAEASRLDLDISNAPCWRSYRYRLRRSEALGYVAPGMTRCKPSAPCSLYHFASEFVGWGIYRQLRVLTKLFNIVEAGLALFGDGRQYAQCNSHCGHASFHGTILHQEPFGGKGCEACGPVPRAGHRVSSVDRSRPFGRRVRA
jgi:hypothetical protein